MTEEIRRGRKVGDHDDSFEKFYRAYVRKVAVTARLSYDDPHEVEDAVQDAFVAALESWERISQLDDDGRQWYVMRIVINKLHSRVRRRKVHRRALEQLCVRQPGALLHVEEAALAGEALRAIRSLPPRQRVVAVMHLVDGVPLADIAAAMGISASTARSHLDRARSTLAGELGEQDLDQDLRLKAGLS